MMRMQATISAAAVGFSLILAPEAIAWVQQETDSPATSVPQARTETQASNGDVVIQVIDGERMVRISQREAGITVTVVETQRGVDKTERYFARTLEQLRKKEPRAYELFQRYRDAEDGSPETDAAPDSTYDKEELARLQAQIDALQRQYAHDQRMLALLNMMRQQTTRSAAGGSGPQRAFDFSQDAQQRNATAQARAFARARSSARSNGETGNSSSSKSSSGANPLGGGNR